MLYSDPARTIDLILEKAAAAGPPVMEVRDEYGVAHRLWMISDAARLEAIEQAMAAQKPVIADGHHRYETALNYRDERRAKPGAAADAPHERAMMTFFNTRSEGLTILPTHRLVARLVDFSWSEFRRYLEPWFESEAFPFANAEVQGSARSQFLERLPAARARRGIGVYAGAASEPRAYHILTLRPRANLGRLLPDVSPLQRELDVVLLHEGILESGLGITAQAVSAETNLTYERDAAAALDAVDRGAAQVAFLLNPVEVEQVVRIATAGEVLPQKSTDFYPKLLSGITMYRLQGEAQ